MTTRAPGMREEGRITLLVMGMAFVATLLVVVTLAITSVALARTRLMDAADGAALAAANALDAAAYAESGIAEVVPLSDDGVRDAAARHLAERHLPQGVSGWSLAVGTGSPDGRTAIVVLTGQVRVPFARTVGSDAAIAVTVQSRARSPLR